MSVLFITVCILSILLNVENSTLNAKEKCKDKNLRPNAHCVQKRAANYWCSSEGCSLCVGNNCPLTCKGFSCGVCPSGSCCDGKNCNACYNYHCCSTPPCNYCIHSCRHACSNVTSCQNICVPQCQNGTNEVFVVPTNVDDPNAIVYFKGKPYKGNIPGGQLTSPNKSAVALINGTEYPATVLLLHPPKPGNNCPQCNNTACSGVFCGKQCMQQCQQTCNTGSCHNTCSNKCIQQPPPQKLGQNFYNLPQGCCHVVHPPKCVTNQIYPYRHCYRKTHTECSNLCTSQFVHLTPHLQERPQCHYIKNYPYIYCGRHSVQNCDSCYICNGQYNPRKCSSKRTCRNGCKKGLYPPTVQQPIIQGQIPQQINHMAYPGIAKYQQHPGLIRTQHNQLQGHFLQYG